MNQNIMPIFTNIAMNSAAIHNSFNVQALLNSCLITHQRSTLMAI